MPMSTLEIGVRTVGGQVSRMISDSVACDRRIRYDAMHATMAQTLAPG